MSFARAESSAVRFRPAGLTCEYLKDPSAIDAERPRFGWITETELGNRKQTAYRIVVSSSRESASVGTGEAWDSGKTVGDASFGVAYAGRPLASGADYYWSVRVWDEEDRESGWAEPACFGTGLLREEDWKAKWITVPGIYDSAPLFRTVFTVDKPLRSAKLHVSGLGYYEARINGCKVGDRVLDPGWTDYRKRILYSTYDAKEMLAQGENAIGVILGEGWFEADRDQRRQQLILQLDLVFEDGSSRTVATDREGWKATGGSPIERHSVYHGEIYNARKERHGWDTAAYREESDWRKPLLAEPPGGRLVAQAMEAIKANADIAPISLSEPKPGVFVYDLGQNIAGWARIRVSGKAGDRVVLKFAEMLCEDGTANQENLRSLKPADVYVLKGGGDEVYEPRFTYHGFRYVQVEGYPGKPELGSLTGKAVHSSVPATGKFSCGVDQLNRMHEAVLWTERNNLHGLPTDCPQRDERLGWLNDMTVRAEEAVYNFGMAPLLSKWTTDIADAQGPATGAITDTAPYVRYGNRPADPVCSSYLIVPWTIYVHYGDAGAMERHYEGFERWFGYLARHTDEHIVSYSYYGDWAPPAGQSDLGSIGAGAVSLHTPGTLISTGYYYLNAVILAKMAAALGREEKRRFYENKASEIAAAMNRAFFDADTNDYATGNQSSNAFALWLGIVPEERRSLVAGRLLASVAENGVHPTTGNLCTKYMIDVLTETGHPEATLALLTQTSYPSWGYMLDNGATTIWERWEHVTTGPMTNMASHDHPMYGAFDSWFYAYLGGIKPSESSPGFRRFELAPVFLKDVGSVSCRLDTVGGTIVSEWEYGEDGLLWKVRVPFNCKATLRIPAASDGAIALASAEGESLWRNGKKGASPAGLRAIGVEEGRLLVEAEAGEYVFRIG